MNKQEYSQHSVLMHQEELSDQMENATEVGKYQSGLQKIRRVVDASEPLYQNVRKETKEFWELDTISLTLGGIEQFNIQANSLLPYASRNETTTYFLNMLRNYFAKSYSDEKKKTALEAFFQKNQKTDENASAFSVTDLFDPNKITDDMLISMLESNRREMEEREQEIRKRLPFIKKKTTDLLHQGISEGILPITYECIENRLSDMNVRLKDALLDKTDYGACYDSDKETIFYSSNHALIDTELSRSYLHETLHALSGKQVSIGYNQFHYGNGESLILPGSIDSTHIHSGLRIFQNDRFEWLNEAITEHLTQIVSGVSDTTYIKERALFYLILNYSDDPDSLEQLFVNAYFEDIPQETRGKTPARTKLRKTLSATFRPGFLARLDRVVKEEGIDKALREMEGNWKQVGGIRKNGEYQKRKV